MNKEEATYFLNSIKVLLDEKKDKELSEFILFSMKSGKVQQINMIEKYGCGHAPKSAIFNTGSIATSAYLTWKEQVEEGNISECFDCYCKKIRKEAETVSKEQVLNLIIENRGMEVEDIEKKLGLTKEHIVEICLKLVKEKKIMFDSDESYAIPCSKMGVGK